MKIKDLVNELISLPVEERTKVVDSVLKSLNPPETEIDKKWVKQAKQRLTELRRGDSKSIPGNEVFNKIWNHYGK